MSREAPNVETVRFFYKICENLQNLSLSLSLSLVAELAIVIYFAPENVFIDIFRDILYISLSLSQFQKFKNSNIWGVSTLSTSLSLSLSL